MHEDAEDPRSVTYDGFGHSKAGVIRPCAERKTQSPSVNTHNLLMSHTVS